MGKIRLYFNDLGFDINSVSGQDFLAKKNGSNFVFLKYIDFYFIKHVAVLSVDLLKLEHKNAITYANKDYMLPKALRLSVPNINSVFIVEKTVSNELITYVNQRKKNLIGGQQDSVFVIDKHSKKMYSAGIETSRISGEAKLVLGNKKVFKTLNGHNRSYYFMSHLFEKLRK